jgi:signal transduction histidine kinase
LSIVEYASLKNISIIFDIEIEEKIISYDSEKIERVRLDLLSNAIKFTEVGGNVNVSIYDEKEYILITVKENVFLVPISRVCNKVLILYY